MVGLVQMTLYLAERTFQPILNVDSDGRGHLLRNKREQAASQYQQRFSARSDVLEREVLEKMSESVNACRYWNFKEFLFCIKLC